MSIRSRFQGLPSTAPQENPNLVPRAPIVDPWASRGRFQQVNLGTNPAEERTKVGFVDDNTRLQTTTNAGVRSDKSAPKVVQKEETTTTVIED